MASTPRTLLSGPLAIIAAVFGVGWLVLAVVMVTFRVPAGFWALTALFCLAGAAVTLVVGYRSSVRLRDDGLQVPGHGVIRWDQIAAVRLAQMEGGWAPLLDVTQGRMLRLVELDGLLARRPDGRVLRQAETIAARAGVELEVTAPRRGGAARPSRAA